MIIFRLIKRAYCTRNGESAKLFRKVSIGDVSVEIRKAMRQELVPHGYAYPSMPKSNLTHLKWLLQKDKLRQDVFLIGAPGSLRRQIVFEYLEITGREYEYIPLTRDTTEADIKQRREIQGGTAYYTDLSAVRAALHGRVLVLDGVEKAERNVLPVLNNLLENREMQLDDGRFLVAPDKFDKLLQEHTPEELEAWQLVRVSENFHVVALGVPVPRFRGHTLDPPLRSRFQARHVQSLAFADHYNTLAAVAPTVPQEKLTNLISFVYGIGAEEADSLQLPAFPVDNLPVGAALWNLNPNFSSGDIVSFLYPHKAMLKSEGQEQVKTAFENFGVDEPTTSYDLSVLSAEKQKDNDLVANVSLNQGTNTHSISMPHGVKTDVTSSGKGDFVSTKYHDDFLARMMISHAVGDFCIVGPRGCGKTALVQKFSDLLGYQVSTLMLYQDMTSRDLLQQRRMLPTGDTVWQESVLIEAARTGKLAVLDGLHRVHHSTLNVLQRLVHDREIELFDGTRLVGADRFQLIMQKTGQTKEQLNGKGVHRIHASFRMVALAEPPSLRDGGGGHDWLTPELLTLFIFQQLRPLSAREETRVVSALVPGLSENIEKKLLDFVQTLRRSDDANMVSLADSLSTRQLVRIMKRITMFPESECLYESIQKACLSRFLPTITRNTLNESLKKSEIKQSSTDTEDRKDLECCVRDGVVHIGQTTMNAYKPMNRTMVPDILFYENNEHVRVMEAMLRDFKLGEHLLLIGNQGVGKNKVADRFLQLLNRPRQYVQLHRDTTVQTLTLQSTVIDGVLVYEDSPLVKAVKHGHVLVIDEGDKAPTHVTCVLKSLIETGEMHLADGRRIVPPHASSTLISDPNCIKMHSDFRVIVLANRPGFPFLGNDFFASLGDQFACHAVDNPSAISEMDMLQRYGPDVPVKTLRKLVSAFADLRDQADQGLLTYPYSTRELVAIVKHMQQFPNDGLPAVVGNVFDFDAFSKDSATALVTILRKHGIPIGVTRDAATSVRLAPRFPMTDAPVKTQGALGLTQGGRALTLDVLRSPLAMKGPFGVQPASYALEKTDERIEAFSDQINSWQLPLNQSDLVSDVLATSTDQIYVASVNPVALHILYPDHGRFANSFDLYHLFPSVQSGYYRPRVKLAALNAASLPGCVLVHEEMTDTLLLVETTAARVHTIGGGDEGGIVKRFTKAATRHPIDEGDQHWRMLGDVAAEHNRVFLYQRNGNGVRIVDFANQTSDLIRFPDDAVIKSAIVMGKNSLLLQMDDNEYQLLVEAEDETAAPNWQLKSVTAPKDIIDTSNSASLNKLLVQSALNENIDSPNRLINDWSSFGALSIGFPEIQYDGDLYRFPKPHASSVMERQPYWASEAAMKFIHPSNKVAFLDGVGQMVRALPLWKTPTRAAPKNFDISQCSGFLEVVDFVKRQCTYLPVPIARYPSSATAWQCTLSETRFGLSAFGEEGVVTADVSGGVRTWETNTASVASSMSAWKRMFGVEEEGDQLKLSIEEPDGDLSKLSDPKHGVTDPTGAPHFGGGTFAGGSGGYNTAGLGGVGGPYRLDIGQDVHQLPDSFKTQVPEEVRQKARAMARRAYERRLKEIQMSEYDADSYERFKLMVDKQIAMLKVVIDSLQAKGKERQWVRHQTSGDLDEGKLIEGLTGEKTVYRRRAKKDPEPGTPQQKPKLLRLCVDVSGSMYRFNGYDGRLQKTLEASLMVMEALEGHQGRIKYDIVGHSGEEPDVVFVSKERPPRNERERLDVLKTMMAHSQYCMSGDHTLEATRLAVKELSSTEADERFVIVLSDANFDRYGISPGQFSEIMTQDDRVNVFAIFIGSLGEQAERLRTRLPAGKTFVCKSTSDIPQMMQQIFTSTVLGSSADDQND